MRFNTPFWRSNLHTVKVLAYIFISGGLTALLNAVGNLNLTPLEQMILMATFNAVLAWINKYRILKA